MNVTQLTEVFQSTIDAMSGLEQTSFWIWLAMTITFFSWMLYLVLSK